MASSGGKNEAEIDDSELDQLIEEYKTMKDSGEMNDLDSDFENHPFFMDHVPTVRIAAKIFREDSPHRSLAAGGGLQDKLIPTSVA